ncbi:MAG: FAD-dependent oxidoreductase [Devosia sp.]
MDKPVIFAVDDDAGVLAAITRDLRKHYASSYEIKRADSGAAALDALRALKLANRPVALLLVDQRMPLMTGVAFLRQAMELFPDAKRVLLTAYADTEAAISAINDVRLDHYLMKPWHPPEDLLYPTLDDLLDDWRANFEPVFEGVRLIGHRWSAEGHRIRDFLARNLIAYRWLDIEVDAEAVRLRDLAGGADAALPIVVLADGTSLANPAVADLAAKLGLHMVAESDIYDLIVVGTGPAGLAAAVYGASEGLRTVLIEREAPGGQAGTSARIENYLGFPVGLSGSDLARRAVAQARRFGAEILSPLEAIKLESRNGYHTLTLSDGSALTSQAMIIATGVSYNRLDVPGAERFGGRGLFYGAAITEAMSIKDQDVFIVGGGNSAGQAAMYLGRYARSVALLVRGDTLVGSMSRYLIERINASDNVRFRMNASIKEMFGGDTLEAIDIVDNKTGAIERAATPGIFCFIGAAPHTDWLKGIVELDEHGYIVSGISLTRAKDNRPPGWLVPRDPFWLETSLAGVFVVGDVRYQSIKRMASAIGEGSMSISFVHQHLRSPEISLRPARPAGG